MKQTHRLSTFRVLKNVLRLWRFESMILFGHLYQRGEPLSLTKFGHITYLSEPRLK